MPAQLCNSVVGRWPALYNTRFNNTAHDVDSVNDHAFMNVLKCTTLSQQNLLLGACCRSARFVSEYRKRLGMFDLCFCFSYTNDMRCWAFFSSAFSHRVCPRTISTVSRPYGQGYTRVLKNGFCKILTYDCYNSLNWDRALQLEFMK